MEPPPAPVSEAALLASLGGWKPWQLLWYPGGLRAVKVPGGSYHSATWQEKVEGGPGGGRRLGLDAEMAQVPICPASLLLDGHTNTQKGWSAKC